MKKIEVNLKREHLELLIKDISGAVVEGSIKELRRVFVTKEQAFYFGLGIVTFILITYCGITWNNPKIIANIKGEAVQTSPALK